MKVYRQIFIVIIGMLVIVLVGTVGFQYFEQLSFFDALWMTVITVLTVGYGDFTPVTFTGRVFALIIIPFSISIVAYALGTLTASVIEGKLTKSVGRRRMERAINSLENHVILCGLGRVGQQAFLHLKQEKSPLVVIEQDKNVLEKFEDQFLYIEGDATEDSILYQAGIERAMGVISALPQDADNIMISLTAKGINPKIQVVARAERVESEEKLLRAGADKVINASSIGGRRMALSILKPVSIDYVDTILSTEDQQFQIEEIMIQNNSTIADKSIKENNIRENYQVTVIAIKKGEKVISYPSAEELLSVNNIVVVFGTKENLLKFEQDSKAVE